MVMSSERYFRNLFRVGGIWNLGAAGICWLGAVLATDFFFGIFAMSRPPSLFPFHAMFSMVLVFGLGFIIVSRDLQKNQGIVLMGVIGKILFFLFCLLTHVQGEANFGLLAVGIVDLLFAGFFIDFWVKRQRERRPEI